MAVNQQRRLKKLAKQKARRKNLQRESAKRRNESLFARMERAASCPIVDSVITGDTSPVGGGMVTATISRKMPDNQIAVATFLVDMYCLGVKDVFCRLMSRNEYEREFLPHLLANDEGTEGSLVSPAQVMGLVVQAVAYAGDLGISPHADYRRVAPIFGDIDPAECPVEFEFGSDGKPCFVAGPNDSPARCQRICGILRDRLGPDGFHYIMPLNEFDGPHAMTLGDDELMAGDFGEDDFTDEYDDGDDADGDAADEGTTVRFDF